MRGCPMDGNGGGDGDGDGDGGWAARSTSPEWKYVVIPGLVVLVLVLVQ